MLFHGSLKALENVQLYIHVKRAAEVGGSDPDEGLRGMLRLLHKPKILVPR